jgi:hypothetical protein
MSVRNVVFCLLFMCFYANASEENNSSIRTQKYSLIDRHNVSLAYGSALYSPDPLVVGSGGNTISRGFIYSNSGYELTNSGGWKEVKPKVSEEIYHLVSSGSIVARFLINADGSYTPLSDLRLTLENLPDGKKLLIDAVGNEYVFNYGTTYYSSNLERGGVIHVKYANGFKETYRARKGVNGDDFTLVESNTGYGIYLNVLWEGSYGNLKSKTIIQGINLTKLPCYSIECADENRPSILSYSKPYSSAPNDGDQWTVIHRDQDGVETEIDMTKPNLSYTKGNTTRKNNWTFLTEIREPSGKKIKYDYQYDFYDQIEYPVKPELKTSTVGNDTIGYDSGDINSRYGWQITTSGGYQTFNYAYFDVDRGTPEKISTWSENIEFTEDWQSLMKSYTQKNNGDNQVFIYEYDSRGNVAKVTRSGLYSKEAEYQSICNSSNRKYCNKPTWTTDWSSTGNYHKTYYEYYPEHGSLKTITHPDNSVERFFYKKYFAKYLNESGQLVSYSDGIYLLDYKKSCKSTKSSSCSSDEVTTYYQYEPNNLNLQSVTTSDINSSYKVCYQYDELGRQISEYYAPNVAQSCQ